MSSSKKLDWLSAANAIKTTDTFPEFIKKCKIDGFEIEIVGIAKGSGMIAPNMSTMLVYIYKCKFAIKYSSKVNYIK